MKYIDKKSEPPEFKAWKSKARKVPPKWKTLRGKVKQKVNESLLEEQGGLCCYCKIEVDREHGHIDHLLPRHDHHELVFAYSNLLYSCPEKTKEDREEEDTEKKVPQTCGHAKGNNELPITPRDKDCEKYFIYTEYGDIRGKNDDARETIRILNLNGSQLVCNRRQSIYEETRETKNTLTPEEFDQWINSVLQRQSDGTFEPFWTTIKYAAGLYT